MLRHGGGETKLTVFARVLQSFRTGNSEDRSRRCSTTRSPLRPGPLPVLVPKSRPAWVPRRFQTCGAPGCGLRDFWVWPSPLLLTMDPTFPPLIPRCQVTAQPDATSGPDLHNKDLRFVAEVHDNKV